jgi:hypothetical protein
MPSIQKIGAGAGAMRELGEKLLADQSVMAWLRPEEKLAPWWKTMIREFSQRDQRYNNSTTRCNSVSVL